MVAAMPARMDICLQRNEDWAPTLVFIWPDDGKPIDLTGCTMAMHVRDKLTNTGAPIATGTCTITSAIDGTVQILLLGSSGPLASYGNPLHAANLYYDIRATDPDGIHVIVFAGKLILERGITHD